MMAEDNWYGDDVATFGDRLAAAREAAGISQKDLAQRIGVRRETVAAWEDDRKEPRANRLQMLSGLLSVSLAWLLAGHGDGVQAPDQEDAPMADVSAIMRELRQIRVDMAQTAEALARVEKRLRSAIAGAQ